MKRIILLGASGSIGTQTLDILEFYNDKFTLEALTVGNRDEHLEQWIDTFNPKAVALRNEQRRLQLSETYPHIKFYDVEHIVTLIDETEADLVVNAIVGIAGLKPTVAAIENKMHVALANKETLVAGGDLVIKLLGEYGVTLLPVDSEHSAIWQALIGKQRRDIHSITLTASGGSFRDLTRDQLNNVSKEDALNHPNWSMGEKITIDSATMMNKGLEVIEAHYLFGIPYGRINVLMHHQSIIHSYVQFNDYSILAQAGTTSMKVPIQFALTFPNHNYINKSEALDLAQVGQLTFADVDFERFPLVALAYEVGRQKGNKPIVMNAANEAAVHLFLQEKINFLNIETLVINTTRKYDYEDVKSFDQVYEINDRVKEDVLANYNDIIEMEITW